MEMEGYKAEIKFISAKRYLISIKLKTLPQPVELVAQLMRKDETYKYFIIRSFEPILLRITEENGNIEVFNEISDTWESGEAYNERIELLFNQYLRDMLREFDEE